MMSFVSFESFHQEILYQLFSVLVSSSLSHPPNEVSLKKRASFNNLSIKPLWAFPGGMAELLQPFLALSPSLFSPRNHVLNCMAKPLLNSVKGAGSVTVTINRLSCQVKACIQLIPTAS